MYIWNRLRRDVLCGRVAVMVGIGSALCCVFANAQIAVKSEEISARFGVQGQLWANWAQDPTRTVPGYTQNLFLRRLRVMAGRRDRQRSDVLYSNGFAESREDAEVSASRFYAAGCVSGVEDVKPCADRWGTVCCASVAEHAAVHSQLLHGGSEFADGHQQFRNAVCGTPRPGLRRQRVFCQEQIAVSLWRVSGRTRCGWSKCTAHQWICAIRFPRCRDGVHVCGHRIGQAEDIRR